jgi:predicted nucleic acid-binding protein
VEYDRATGSDADRRLAALIAATHRSPSPSRSPLKVLAGARDDERDSDLRRLLLRFHLLRCHVAADFDAAARIYKRCRRVGVTPRGMIAAVAWRSRATVLAWDADLDRVATVVGVDLDEASLRA